MTTATTTTTSPTGRVVRALGTGTPVYALLAVLLAALALTDPGFYEPDRFLAFVKRAAPLVILAAGQYLVIVCGEFDLSVGAIVTAGVVVAAELYGSYPGAHWLLVTAVLLAAGALAGLVSGLVTTALRVPSFITTLGMMLILEGAVFFWTGGSPHGALPTAFRQLGRGTTLGWLPWAVLACAAAAVAVALLMRSDFGRTLVATGDSERAAALAGVRVARARTIAFVLSGTGRRPRRGPRRRILRRLRAGGPRLRVRGDHRRRTRRSGPRRRPRIGRRAMAGAFSLQALFTLLNLQGVSGALESTVQGVVVIAAVGLGAADWSRLRRRTHPSGGEPS